jgi:hypothetical protein
MEQLLLHTGSSVSYAGGGGGGANCRKMVQQVELVVEERFSKLSEAPATNTGAGSGFVFGASLASVTSTGEVTSVYGFYKTRKRTAPTIVLYDRAGNSGKASRLQAGVAWTDNITATVNTANDENGLNCYTSSGSTATGMGFHYTADSEL